MCLVHATNVKAASLSLVITTCIDILGIGQTVSTTSLFRLKHVLYLVETETEDGLWIRGWLAVDFIRDDLGDLVHGLYHLHLGRQALYRVISRYLHLGSQVGRVRLRSFLRLEYALRQVDIGLLSRSIYAVFLALQNREKVLIVNHSSLDLLLWL